MTPQLGVRRWTFPDRMKMSMQTDFARKPRVGMISLGCAKNLVDAEIMLGSVLQRGMEITARVEDADVLVVNTCAFIDSAKQESIDAILEAHQQHGLNKRPDQKLIVSGCMSQRFAKELRNELPEVDEFIGLDQVAQLGEIVERLLSKRPTPKAFASRRSNAQRSTFEDRSLSRRRVRAGQTMAARAIRRGGGKD